MPISPVQYETRNDKSQSRLVKLADGKVVGGLSSDGVFVKRVIGSKHKLRTPEAWCIDAQAFDEEIRPRATQIVVIDRESGFEYKASIDHFDQHKGTLDRGFGLQYFLVLSQWEVIEPNGDKPQQLTLWGDEGNGQKS